MDSTGKRYRSYCKKCHYESSKKWRAKNKDRINEANKLCKRRRALDPVYVRKRRQRQIEIHRKYKHDLTIFAGGKCVKCSYDKCDGALEFHHIDIGEKEKLFVVSHRSRHNLKNLIREGKVILLCSNCHREEHYIETLIYDGVVKVSG